MSTTTNENNKYALFSFGGLSLKVYYPLIMSLSHVIVYISYEFLSLNYSKNDEGKTHSLNDHNCFLIFIMFLIEFLVIIVYFIHLYLSKSRTHIYILQPKQKAPCEKIKNALVLMSLFFLCFLEDFISGVTNNIIRMEEVTSFFEVLLKVLRIPFISLLSVLILHYKYYKHHYIGYIITAIGLIIYPIYTFIKTTPQSSEESMITKIAIISGIIVVYLMSSFLDVIEKYLVDFKFISPYLIIAVEGFIGTCLVFPLFTLYNLIFPSEQNDPLIKDLSNCIEMIRSEKYYQIGIVLYCIGIYTFNIMRLLTNQRCSPVHRIVSDTLSTLLAWIIHLCVPLFNASDQADDKKLLHIVIEGVGYAIVLIGLTIFLEFIVINKWGMNKNTTFNIDKRALEENISFQNDGLFSSIVSSEKADDGSENISKSSIIQEQQNNKYEIF